jgi:hypothetical protein
VAALPEMHSVRGNPARTVCHSGGTERAERQAAQECVYCPGAREHTGVQLLRSAGRRPRNDRSSSRRNPDPQPTTSTAFTSALKCWDHFQAQSWVMNSLRCLRERRMNCRRSCAMLARSKSAMAHPEPRCKYPIRTGGRCADGSDLGGFGRLHAEHRAAMNLRHSFVRSASNV